MTTSPYYSVGAVDTVEEHVYCVAITFKMSEYSNETTSNFVLTLNISPQKLLDDSKGCSYGQLVIGSFITTTYLLI